MHVLQERSHCAFQTASPALGVLGHSTGAAVWYTEAYPQQQGQRKNCNYICLHVRFGCPSSVLWGVWAIVRLFWTQVTYFLLSFLWLHSLPSSRMKAGLFWWKSNKTSTYSMDSQTGRSLVGMWERWHLPGLHKCRKDGETKTKSTIKLMSA